MSKQESAKALLAALQPWPSEVVLTLHDVTMTGGERCCPAVVASFVAELAHYYERTRLGLSKLGLGIADGKQRGDRMN